MKEAEKIKLEKAAKKAKIKDIPLMEMEKSSGLKEKGFDLEKPVKEVEKPLPQIEDPKNVQNN